MSGIGIITNPHSKLNKRNPKRPELLAYILGDRGQVAATDSLDDITRVAEKFKENDIEILAINGGDGTISHTLTAFEKVYGDTPLPKVAILRGGTMNVLASSLGIFGQPEKILYRLVERYSSDDLPDFVEQDSIQVNDQTGFLFATGIAPTVLIEYYKNKSGSVKAALLVGKIWLSGLLKLDYFSKIIRTDKDTIVASDQTYKELDNLSTFCSTVEKLPLGFRFFKMLKGLKKPSFEAIIVNCSPHALLWKLPKLLFSRRSDLNSGKFCLLTETLKIHRDGNIPYTLDGELFEVENTVEVKLGNRFTFLKI